MTAAVFEREALRREHLRRMAEPEDLRALRQQAERLRAERSLRARQFLHDAECERLRREIIAAGHKPCR